MKFWFLCVGFLRLRFCKKRAYKFCRLKKSRNQIISDADRAAAVLEIEAGLAEAASRRRAVFTRRAESAREHNQHAADWVERRRNVKAKAGLTQKKDSEASGESRKERRSVNAISKSCVTQKAP